MWGLREEGTTELYGRDSGQGKKGKGRTLGEKVLRKGLIDESRNGCTPKKGVDYEVDKREKPRQISLLQKEAKEWRH